VSRGLGRTALNGVLALRRIISARSQRPGASPNAQSPKEATVGQTTVRQPTSMPAYRAATLADPAFIPEGIARPFTAPCA
jgi:hypothetical protein